MSQTSGYTHDSSGSGRSSANYLPFTVLSRPFADIADDVFTFNTLAKESDRTDTEFWIHEEESYIEQGRSLRFTDVENAFLHYAKAAVILRVKLPSLHGYSLLTDVEQEAVSAVSQ